MNKLLTIRNADHKKSLSLVERLAERTIQCDATTAGINEVRLMTVIRQAYANFVTETGQKPKFIS